MYSKKWSNLQSVILEVPADIYKNIRENNNKVFVGFQSCRVFDVINIKPCANCAGFGHNSAKCKNKTICLRCAGTHKTELCNSEHNHKCANCFFSNNKYKTNYNLNHEPTEWYVRYLKKWNKKIYRLRRYTVKPKIDRYIGKIYKMESHRQGHDASVNSHTIPQSIKNKSALPTGNPTAANSKTAAHSSTSIATSTLTNSSTTTTTASTSTNSTTTSRPQQIPAKPVISTVKTRSNKSK